MAVSKSARAKKPSGRPIDAETALWFFDNALDLFAIIDREGVFSEVGGGWERVTGWTREDLVGRSVFDLLDPDSVEEARDSRRRIKRDGQVTNCLRVRKKDGGWLWLEGRSRLGPQDEMIGTLRDVTEDRARQAELEAARRTQALLSEAAGIGAWSYDPLERRIHWSDDIQTLTGWTAEELSQLEDLYLRTDETQRGELATHFEHGVATGRGAAFEHRMATRDGRWLTLRTTFRTEPRGPAFALRGISQDITALVGARDAARDGQRRVMALMEQARMDAWRQELALSAAQAGAFAIDHEAKTLWATDEFFRLVGRHMTYEEAARPMVWPFVHPDDHALVISTNQRWTRGEPDAVMEFRIFLPDGEERWVRVFYRLDEATRKGVGLVLDIDASKRQELALVEAQKAAEAAAEAKARFLANMSHEIRTPMNGVLGVLHLLKGEGLSAGGRKLLDEALNCGKMLTSILDDVIDFERIEAGQLELSTETVDVGDLARGVVRMLEDQASRTGLFLRIEGAETLGMVTTDPVRLRQCLFNLIGNAVKFTLRGGVTVRCLRPAPGRLAFAIEDTGVGIRPDAQGQLFERFHQADASTTRRFGGSGLGLAITRRLAGLLGGEVSFESTPGEGSVFRLEIAAPEAAGESAPDAAPDAMLEGLRVLVVEDNPTNRIIILGLLESLGATARAADDGVAGVAAAAVGGYDLILMDIQMPGIDGMEATRRIRALPGPVASAPIIALTANVLAHQRDAYLAAGMDGVVGKPISPLALLAEIARLSAGAETEAACV